MTASRELHELRTVFDQDGPFATVYLDASRDTESGTHEVELRWRELRRRLEDAGADKPALSAIDAAIADDRAPGRHGLVVVAAGDHVVFEADTPEPPARPEASWSAVPHLMPFVAQQATRPQYVVVVADRTGADISVTTPYGQQNETVEGSAHYPLHKTGRDDWSELHFQKWVENAWDTNASDVADAVRRHVATARPSLVVIAGDPRARGLLAGQLGSTVAGAEVVEVSEGGRAAGSSDEALAEAVRDALLRHVWRRRRELLERLQQDVGRDKWAATGVRAVVDALRQARVDTLVISDDPTSTLRGWSGHAPTDIALERDELTAAGVDDPREDRLDAVLVRAAIGTGAQVYVTPGAHDYLPEGIAAILRY